MGQLRSKIRPLGGPFSPLRRLPFHEHFTSVGAVLICQDLTKPDVLYLVCGSFPPDGTWYICVRCFLFLQWRQEGGTPYEKTEIQDTPHPCREQHRDPEPEPPAQCHAPGKPGHRLPG